MALLFNCRTAASPFLPDILALIEQSAELLRSLPFRLLQNMCIDAGDESRTLVAKRRGNLPDAEPAWS